MRSVAACLITPAILGLTAVLLGWMLAQVAEHPGVPREVEASPSWFTGLEQRSAPKPEPARAESVAAVPASPPAAAKTTADEGFVKVNGGTVAIGLSEYKFEPGNIKVAAGKITFVLRNAGRFAHNFQIEGNGVDVTASKFMPGATARLELSLEAGQYKISCPLSNHDERGMSGMLIVSAEGN